MYPAQGDEIVLVLYEEQFLLIFCVTIVWPATLFWYDDMRHSKRIPGLEQTQKSVPAIIFFWIMQRQPPSAKKAIQGLRLNKINRALIGLLLAKMLGHARHKTDEQLMTQFKEKPQQIRESSAEVSVI